MSNLRWANLLARRDVPGWYCINPLVLPRDSAFKPDASDSMIGEQRLNCRNDMRYVVGLISIG